MRGQITIIAIIFAFIALITLAIMAPLFSTAVDLIINNTAGDQTSQTLARFIFPVLLLSLLVSILGYGSFNRPQPQYQY